MNQHEIVFTLSDKERIVVEVDHPLDVLHCCYRAPIIFFDGLKAIAIFNWQVQGAIESLRDKLKEAVAGKLKLHASIQQDIGYLFNQYYQEKPGLVYDESGSWVGRSENHVWSIWEDGSLDTWLYNDVDGNIILEITPQYPWHSEDSERGIDYIPYEKWIELYQPYLIKKIPNDVAQQWFEQADRISKAIEENIVRDQAEALAENE